MVIIFYVWRKHKLVIKISLIYKLPHLLLLNLYLDEVLLIFH